jgi:hypothetical protein
VRRLIRALAGPRAFFFIHIDAKSALAPFEMLRDEPRTELLNDRVAVHWGGYSQVQATRRLLTQACSAKDRFRRYTLLSGADFPIKPREEIERVLLESDREFLRIDRKLTGSPRNDYHFASIERIHRNDNPWFNRYAPPPKPGVPWLHTVTVRSFDFAARCLPRRRFVAGLTPYHGSQWWSLTDACVRYLQRYLDVHPEYERFHRSVRAPDEIFFHSIIKSSPFAAAISHDFEAGPMAPNDHGVHYIDWNSPGVSLPKVLDLPDQEALQQSSALFARKFDVGQSAALIAALERSWDGSL